MIDIVNHSVKIRDIGLLQFMYPDFIILDKPVLFIDKPFIFIGETKYLNRMKELGVNYIIVTELAEYDLTDRRTLLEVTFGKYNKEIPKYVLSFYEDLDDNTFRELFEYHWITGKWLLKEYNNVGVFLEFLMSFKTDTYTIGKTYLQLLDKVGAEYIEMSLLTFLNRVVSPSGKLSKWYQQTIDNYKLSKYSLIKPAIENYMESPVYNTDLRMFNLIMDLNRKYQN